MPRTIEIRRAVVADVPAVVALWCEIVEHHAAIAREFTLAEGGAETFGSRLSQRVECGDDVVFLALDSGVAAGFIRVRASEPRPVFVGGRVAEVTDLGVVHRFRRSGVGTALWQHAARWCREQGFEHVDLGVLAGNEGAHRFWTGLGFRPRFAQMRLEL